MKYILSFIISLLLIGNILSQVKRVNIDVYGEFEVVVKIYDGSITINNLGEIIDIDIDGNTDYYLDSFREGKVEQIGDIYFDYYIDSFRKGKVQQIGDVYFDYYIDSFREGKLESVNHIKVDYYIVGSNEDKVESIGSNRFDYFIAGIKEGKLESGNRSFFYNGIRFKLKGGY